MFNITNTIYQLEYFKNGFNTVTMKKKKGGGISLTSVTSFLPP